MHKYVLTKEEDEEDEEENKKENKEKQAIEGENLCCICIF